MKSLSKIIFTAAALCGLLCGAVASEASDNSSLRKKARYYYLAGASEDALENQDTAYEFYKKALATDSSFVDASFAVGLYMFAADSREDTDRALAMMRKYVDANPKDRYHSEQYGYILQMLNHPKEAATVYERLVELFPDKTDYLLTLSRTYSTDKQYEKSIETLNRYEAIEGVSSDVTALKASLYLVLEDSTSAVGEVDKLCASDPYAANNLLLKGALMNVLERPADELECYLQAERLAPESGYPKMSLATFYKNSGDSLLYYDKVYDALLAEDLDIEQKGKTLGEYLEMLVNENGSTERGDFLFDVLLRQYPHNPLMLEFAARYSAAKKDYDKAIENIRYAIDMESGDLELWQQLVSFLIQADRNAEAVEAFNEALVAMHPEEVPPNFYMLGGSAAMFDDNYPMAIKIISQGLTKILPDVDFTAPYDNVRNRDELDYDGLLDASMFFGTLGDLYAGIGEIENAVNAYESSLFLWPDNITTLNNYAYMMIAIGPEFLESAREMSSKAVQGDPDNPTYLDTYAWILYMGGEYEEAATFQAKAIGLAELNDQGDAELYDHYGDILFRLGKKDKALEMWQKAAEFDPTRDLLQLKIKTRQLP